MPIFRVGNALSGGSFGVILYTPLPQCTIKIHSNQICHWWVLGFIAFIKCRIIHTLEIQGFTNPNFFLKPKIFLKIDQPEVQGEKRIEFFEMKNKFTSIDEVNEYERFRAFVTDPWVRLCTLVLLRERGRPFSKGEKEERDLKIRDSRRTYGSRK